MIRIDMDMPKSCFECDLKVASWYDGDSMCALTDKPVYNMDDARKEDCPLIEM